MSARRTQPAKAPRRPAEVCAELDIQPYVLKFWESEFPQLGRRVGPKRNYGDKEIAIVKEIRRLLEEEGLSLSDARDFVNRSLPEDESAQADAAAGRSRDAGAAQRLEAALADLERTRRALDDARGQLAELDELRAERDQLKVDLASRATAAGSGDAQPADVLRELDDERRRVHGLQDELRRAWEEASRLREQSAGLAEQARELEQRISASDEELHGLRARAAEADQLAEQAAALEQEIAARASDVEQAAEERARLEQELSESVRRAEESARAAAETARALEEIAAARDERDSLRAHLDSLATQRRELEIECQELRRAVAEGSQRTPVLERELAAARAERERVSADLNAALAQVDAIVSATEDLILEIGAASVTPDHRRPKDWAAPPARGVETAKIIKTPRRPAP